MGIRAGIIEATFKIHFLEVWVLTLKDGLQPGYGTIALIYGSSIYI
jgi:hypothetical protein